MRRAHWAVGLGLLATLWVARGAAVAGSQALEELSPAEYRRLRALCFRLGENAPGKKWDAARALIREGPRAVPVVAEILKGEWAEGKRMAAWVLSQIRHPRAVGPLARALGDEDEQVRWKAAVGLKGIGKASVFALVAMLLSGNVHAKHCAAWALGEIGDPAGGGALAAALEEDDEALRWKAAISLSQIGPPALPTLTEPLRHKSVATRRCAVWAAGKIGGKAALPILEQALRDPDNHVRAKAVVALGDIEGEAATELLLRMVDDPDAVVRQDAIVALGRRGRTLDPAARVRRPIEAAKTEVPLFALHEIAFTPKAPPQVANPFTDALCSASFVSPDDRTIRVRGFYGGGTWKVRMAFDTPGEWYYRIDLRAGERKQTRHGAVQCVRRDARGFLRVARDHRRTLAFDDGSRFYPIGTGTETLSHAAQGGQPTNTLEVWRRYLEACAKGGMNKSRIVLLEVPWVRPEVVRAHPEVSPWPLGADGRYDLSRFALAFWDKLDAVIALGAERGIVFELTIFDETALSGSDGDPWAGHPFNAANGGPLQGLAGSPRFYDLSIEASRQAQEAYVAYLLARTAACTNVYYELNVGMNRRGAADRLGPRWAEHWARFFRQHDPFDHLVSLHVVQNAQRYFTIDGFDIANVHGRQPPEPTGIRMPVFLTQTHVKTHQAERAVFWKALLLGTSAARVPWQSLAERTPAFQHLRYLADFARTVRYWELRRDTVSVLSTPGGTESLAAARRGELFVYLTGRSQGGEVRVGLPNGRYDVSWFDPRNGRTVRSEEARPSQGAVALACPTFEEDMVLRIRRK